MPATDVRPLLAADGPSCDAIVASLPYHFGNAAGRADCAAAVRSQAGAVATRDRDVVGFATWRLGLPAALEITWLAVHAHHRGTGLGRRIVAAAAGAATAAGASYLVVATLSASVAEPGIDGIDGYARTRRFYERNGFVPLWEPHGWWSDEDQAMLMVRPATLAG